MTMDPHVAHLTALRGIKRLFEEVEDKYNYMVCDEICALPDEESREKHVEQHKKKILELKANKKTFVKEYGRCFSKYGQDIILTMKNLKKNDQKQTE